MKACNTPFNGNESFNIGDLIVSGLNQQEIAILDARQKFIQVYFQERGWDIENPSMEQILEVRQQDEWENPSVENAS